ncbi:hypothetical protein IQ07DRAFT_638967 [Pyrenochaeta sp. DS3sAY3a]|nr:hypothetical protein IQ07DRAFT_638967 [Pyrenochaeta sp. DS3sAY3a]
MRRRPLTTRPKADAVGHRVQRAVGETQRPAAPLRLPVVVVVVVVAVSASSSAILPSHVHMNGHWHRHTIDAATAAANSISGPSQPDPRLHWHCPPEQRPPSNSIFPPPDPSTPRTRVSGSHDAPAGPSDGAFTQHPACTSGASGIA